MAYGAEPENTPAGQSFSSSGPPRKPGDDWPVEMQPLKRRLPRTQKFETRADFAPEHDLGWRLLVGKSTVLLWYFGVHESFRLAIGLWMGRSRREMFDAVGDAEIRKLGAGELGTVVADQCSRHTQPRKQRMP
ncbi:uncharacterized protein LOC134223607 [Armigeres subalbatus]|uniref:uncharacterized protein LOC134223607 n=1 Tax=Armigeres subalbatus TaxID=124917 RepID=UPI002ECFB35A